MDTGREDGSRSAFVLAGVGESRAGPARCCGDEDEDEYTSSLAVAAEGLEGDETEVGERGGPPKADINESTKLTQGVSKML